MPARGEIREILKVWLGVMLFVLAWVVLIAVVCATFALPLKLLPDPWAELGLLAAIVFWIVTVITASIIGHDDDPL